MRKILLAAAFAALVPFSGQPKLTLIWSRARGRTLRMS